MMHPYDLVGMEYRLGASPDKHGKADCLTLAKAVLTFQGIKTPPPQRLWYRRLLKGETEVFRDELDKWGDKVTSPRLATVALCHAPSGYGMATYFENGWIGFVGSEVSWIPTAALPAVALYSCRLK